MPTAVPYPCQSTASQGYQLRLDTVAASPHGVIYLVEPSERGRLTEEILDRWGAKYAPPQEWFEGPEEELSC